MRTIHKYEVQLTTRQAIEMPAYPKCLTFQVQDGKATLWAEVNTENDVKPKVFYVFGTGHAIPRNRELNYIGTIQHDGLVWHLYQER